MTHVRELLARDRRDLSAADRARIDAHLATCGECRQLQAELARGDRLLSGREPYVPIPRFERRSRPRGRPAPLALATAGALALVAIVVLAPILGGRAERAARPTATPPASASATAISTASPLPPGTYENAILGYRVSLPDAYRRSASSIVTGSNDFLGRDTYTSLSEAEERAECQRDRGDIPSPADAAYLSVEAYRNVAGAPAVEWARGRPENAHRTAVPVTIDGHDAAKLLQQGETQAYAIGGNDRIYVITPTLWPTPHRLDDIAAAFKTIAPQPFPTPTGAASRPAREAARELADALAKAFSARDADAVAALIRPGCWIGVFAVLEPVQRGNEGCCIVNRAVGPFVQALRERLAVDLRVTVDPEVQVEAQGGSERYFVRSTWTEPGRTRQIDLFFSETGGKWYWVEARHHYPRTDLPTICYGSLWSGAFPQQC